MDYGIPAVRVREAKLHWQPMARLAVCVVPAVFFLGFGHLMLGARYLAISLSVMLLYLLVKGDHHEYMAVVIGALPVLSFFRDVFFYFSIIVFLGGGLLLWICKSGEE